MSKELRLWYRQPAEHWEEALPLGNGRIGAMVFGGVERERIALNEDTLWSGYPRDTDVHGAAQHYARAQELAAEGRLAEAQRWIEKHMLGTFSQSYLPLGDLMLRFDGCGEAEEYERGLSLNDAVATVEYLSGGVKYTRELFVSHPDQALVIRISADRPGSISCEATFECQLKHEVSARDGILTLQGICPTMVRPVYLDEKNPVYYSEDDAQKGMRFASEAAAEAVGGVVEAADGVLRVRGADELVLKLTVRTGFNGFDRHPFTEGRDALADCRRDREAVCGKSFAGLLKAHTGDCRRYFDRVELDLGGDRYIRQPTDVRLKRFAEQQDDTGLCELIFQYGRYLTIAASRPGTQPTNLQGIWNQHLRAPWSSNYTVNINTEMNYWPAEPTNLSEMHRPLTDMVRQLRVTGARTAREEYGARGATAHHNVDLWRMSNPVGENRPGSAVFAFWCMSFGWLCRHMYEHYAYTMDRAFLRDEALPAIRDAARFYLDVLTDVGGGRLAVSPMTSPENSFIIDGETVSVARWSTMANAIVREVFEEYLSAVELLGEAEEMAEEVRRALPKIVPFLTDSQGRLLEWDREYEEKEVHHRHVSHLYALYPGELISMPDTPELCEACRRTLEIRGDDGTGWSLGWKISFWARLHDGDHALRLIKRQLRFVEAGGEVNYMGGGGTYMNLFDAHPPFQIDGNFGATAGIAQLFVQCIGDRLLLLPALPSEWKTGSITGLRAKNGVEVDVYFADGALKKAVLRRTAECAKPVEVHYAGGKTTLELAMGETAELGAADFGGAV